tara:strand:+ start:1381 stop:1893 length:513 start_codon:yes stop_codon:yes gene_type:complete
MKIIDTYYKRPVLYDYLLSIILIGVFVFFDEKFDLKIIESNLGIDLSSDIGTVGLTVSGFILTLATILITFKSGQLLSDENLDDYSSPFKIFLSSRLYRQAINILKFGVLSLVTISILIFVFKILSGNLNPRITLFANIVGLVIISTTFIRCFYVLNIILKMQEHNPDNE